LDLTCTSLGFGIGLVSKDKGPWAIVVPFALPGEKARVRIGKNDRMHSTGEVLEMLTHNPDLRDNSRIKCKYFGTCAGCQYQVSFFSISFFPPGGTVTDILQMLSAETQLDLKKDVIQKAYNIYSSTLSYI
jgi:tRNA (uracil-5-)-methyltransferase